MSDLPDLLAENLQREDPVKKTLLIITLLSFVSLLLACQQGPSQQGSTGTEPGSTRTQPGSTGTQPGSTEKGREFGFVAAAVPPDFCAPLGDPIAGGAGLSGANAFALCQIGANPVTTALFGKVTQYSIRCLTTTLRSGWKWRIYCNIGRTHCNCSLQPMENNPADVSVAAWSAGDHCNVNGQARPSLNGCDGW